MTQLADSPAHWQQRRREWVARVDALVRQLAEWCIAEGWNVARDTKALRDRLSGEYEAPALQIRPPEGEIRVEPIALHPVDVDGKVDVKAYPTLSRVRLIGVPGGWEIMTDSNVPLRVAWCRESFVQLVHDLLA